MITATQLCARVVANNDWLAYCKNLHADEHRRIGEEARKIRTETGASVRQVAEKMGKSAMLLSDLERGNRLWTTDTMDAWHNAITVFQRLT